MKDDKSPFSGPKGKKFLPMPSAHSSKSVKRYVHVVDMCAWVYVYVCMYNIICMYVIVITYLQVPYICRWNILFTVMTSGPRVWCHHSDILTIYFMCVNICFVCKRSINVFLSWKEKEAL